MDEHGRPYVPGYIVVPGCTGALAEARLYACPLADAFQPWVGTVLAWHRAVKQQAAHLVDLLAAPSVAAWEALDTLDAAHSHVLAAEHRQAVAEAKQRAAAKAKGGPRGRHR